MTCVRREEDGLWLELEETIAQHHEVVFHALTTSDGLTRWFPVGAEIDLRQGGLLVLGWDEKMRRTTTIAILDYDAGGRITWDWYAADGDTHAPVSFEVEPAVEDGAKVRFRQGPFAETIEGLRAMVEEAQSWRWYLCNLRTTLEARHDMRRVRPL